jgi:hypothetical protein
MVGIVDYSACGKCVGVSSNVVTDWGRLRGGGKYTGRKWMKRDRKSSWGRNTNCSTRKGQKVKGVRIGIRK